MIIKSKTIAVNFSTVMKNLKEEFLSEDVIRSIEQQAPELLKFTKNIDKWIPLEELETLINSLDDLAEQNIRFQTSSISKSVKKESSKVYASTSEYFDPDNLIELGYSVPVALNETISNTDLIKELKNRAADWSSNIETKNLLHSAIYQISLLKQTEFYIANPKGMDEQ